MYTTFSIHTHFSTKPSFNLHRLYGYPARTTQTNLTNLRFSYLMSITCERCTHSTMRPCNTSECSPVFDASSVLHSLFLFAFLSDVYVTIMNFTCSHTDMYFFSEKPKILKYFRHWRPAGSCEIRENDKRVWNIS